MKLFAKVAVFTATLGLGATLLAAPGLGSHDEALNLAHARTIRGQMEGDFQKLQRLQLRAQAAKDIIKLNCVNDKLVQAKPEMNLGDMAVREIEAGHDTSGLAQLETAANTVRSLAEAASQCIDSKLISSVSSNSFSAFGVHPVDPGTEPPYVEPPTYASPPGM